MQHKHNNKKDSLTVMMPLNRHKKIEFKTNPTILVDFF